ncbi:OB-fold nucleic acid binding domain-containing protein, partial [Pseudomonadota bacterium]
KNVLKNGNISIAVGDSTGVIEMLIFESLRADHEKYQAGSYIEVTGKIKKYKGTLEIQPRGVEDIKTYSVIKGYITADDVGKDVVILAHVVSKYVHPKGHLFLTVSVDGSAQELKAPVFNASPSFQESIHTGATVRIQGEISLYKDELQIIPEFESNIYLVGESAVDEPVLIAIGDITRDDRGKSYQVRALIESISLSNGHAFMTLMDFNTKDKIEAVLFRADSEEIMGRKVKLIESEKNGMPVRLLVSVNIYDDELQLIIDKVFNRF